MTSPAAEPRRPHLGALVVTAREHEVESLVALLDSIDVDVARAWVVLQQVPSDAAEQIAHHEAVAQVRVADLIPLSHARNLALHELYAAIAVGEVEVPAFIGFPDADGSYAPGALQAVAEAVLAGSDIVVGRYGPATDAIDELRFPTDAATVDWALVRSRATSVTLFLSGPAAIQLGYVMPYLGLGTPWPAGEDVELALRALRRGYSGAYVPAAVTWHPYGTEFDPARRPIRYLLVAAYPPPGGTTVVRSLRRLVSRPAAMPAAAAKVPDETANGTQGLGAKAELQAVLKGVSPALVRLLRSFANASPEQQWALVQRDGPSGSPTN